MERLTTRSVLGGWTLKVPRQKAVDRLATYEDTGLEPGELSALVKARDAGKKERKKWVTAILAERDRQDAKWGYPQENTYCEWSSILAEETGELAKELNELNFGRGDLERMREEAVQVAAVALSILEQQETAHMVTAAWWAYRHTHAEAEAAIGGGGDG